MIPGWKSLEAVEQLAEIKDRSYTGAVLIFKHSTRCSISSMALNRMHAFPEGLAECYYLDLIAHRDVSNAVAEVFSVPHESPQVLLIVNEECIYEESHYGIQPRELAEQIATAA